MTTEIVKLSYCGAIGYIQVGGSREIGRLQWGVGYRPINGREKYTQNAWLRLINMWMR
jgi:hypothetical protein